MYPTSFAHLFLRLTNVNDKWASLLPDFKQIIYKKNSIIKGVEQFLFFLEKGSIHTSFTSISGTEWIFIFQQQGCLFNELSIFDNSLKFQYTTNSECTVRQIPIKAIQSPGFIEKHPDLYINFIEMLALKESISYSYFSDLAYSSARSKVCQAILALANEHDTTVFNPGITQSEIGAMLGLHQTSVARVIQELRKEHILGAFTKNRAEIFDIDLLRKISNEENQPQPNFCF